MTIALVLFDMNDVLVRYDRAARVACLAGIAGVAPEAVEAAIWGSGFEDRGDGGEMDADAYLEGFGARLGFPLTEGDWTNALRASVTPVPETLALAARMRKRARIALLTNNNLLVKRMAAAAFPDIAPLFGGSFFVSAEFGARKPAPEVYLRCLAQLDASPASTLFVDDSERNVAGAERAGLTAHRYRDPPTLEQALAERKLL